MYKMKMSGLDMWLTEVIQQAASKARSDRSLELPGALVTALPRHQNATMTG